MESHSSSPSLLPTAIGAAAAWTLLLSSATASVGSCESHQEVGEAVGRPHPQTLKPEDFPVHHPAGKYMLNRS